MDVKVLYFATLKDAVHSSEEMVSLAPGAQVKDLAAQLAEAHPALANWLPHIRIAVNLEYAEPQRVLSEGDEVALIPPVSGGAGLFRVQGAELSLDEVVNAVRAATGTKTGAIATFLGVVRENSVAPDGVEHTDIVHLNYEAYAPMAEREMETIGREILEQFGATCAMTHRVGQLVLGEASVAIAVAAPHRAQALDGCRYAIEELKKRVPVFKWEKAASGSWWAEGHGGQG